MITVRCVLPQLMETLSPGAWWLGHAILISVSLMAKNNSNMRTKIQISVRNAAPAISSHVAASCDIGYFLASLFQTLPKFQLR